MAITLVLWTEQLEVRWKNKMWIGILDMKLHLTVDSRRREEGEAMLVCGAVGLQLADELEAQANIH